MAELRLIDGKYQTTRLLGQGGMGAVYEAVHKGTGRRVALKVIITEALQAGEEALVRFQREALASGSIDSQHVVQVLDTGIDPATKSPYMVMEYLAGSDALDAVQKHGPLLPHVVLRITAQACLGLAKAHDAGIVHRDIKSANVYLARRDNNELIVKVLDFGIAKVRADPLAGHDHSLTRTGSMLGSPLYMSPEQAKGAKSLDGRADIWSLGVMMYELLCGETPNHNVTTLGALIFAICAEAPTPIQDRAPWVPPDVAAIVHKALTANLSERYQTAMEMYQACVALLPRGDTSLQEGMLGPIPPAVKSVVAPRWGLTGPHLPQTPLLQATAPMPQGPPQLGNSNHGFAGTGTGPGAPAQNAVTNPSPPATNPAKIVLPIFLVLALVGVGLLVFLKLRPHDKPIAATPSASTAVTPTLPDRVVEVSITPPDATVEVDGAPAHAKDGKLEIKAPAGSVRHVRIYSGNREARAEVPFNIGGPEHIDIDLPPAPSATASAVPTHQTVTKPAPQPGPAPGPAPQPAVKPTGPAKPVPTIDRTM